MTLNDYKHKIFAYFKKVKPDEPLDFELAQHYMTMYTEDDFDNLFKKHFDIKGKNVTVDAIQRAKRKTNNKVLTEYEEQKNFVKWLRDNKIKCASSGNGYCLDTKNNVQYMSKLKATGLSKGFPDLQVFLGKGKTVYIEMKRTKGGTVSEEQQKWIDYLNNNGYKAYICYGADDAIAIVRKEKE